MCPKLPVTTNWLGSRTFLYTLLLLAPLTVLSGCGSGQTDTGQTGSVPVNLAVAFPQNSASVASASTIESRLWAALQSWLPTLTEAWAATTADLDALMVEVKGPGIPSPITERVELVNPISEQQIRVVLNVPVGSDRVFTVSGFNGSGGLIFQGQSSSTTLIVGQAAVVEVILTDLTTGTVTGTVTNTGTGAPLPNATVAVTETSLSTTTDSVGTFTLKGVSPGQQTLTISASGFITFTTQAVTVVAGSSISAGTIALTPLPTTGTVTGTVTNTGTGTPLFGATVTVNGTKLSTATNDNGVFTLHGVPQGPQTLTISASGFTSTTQAVTVVAGSSISAGTIALTPLPTTGTVTGTVTDAGTGGGFPNATVGVTGTSLQTTTNSDGNFTLNAVPQGPQTVTVSASGYASKTKAVTVVAGSSVSAGTITLNPAELANIQVTSYDRAVNLCFHARFITYPLDPKFNPETLIYTVDTVPDGTQFCIVMTKTSREQTVTLNNIERFPVPGDDPFVLYPIVSVSESAALFTIVVTAPNRVTQKTYTITVTPFFIIF